jgi:subtilisin family serine protease
VKRFDLAVSFWLVALSSAVGSAEVRSVRDAVPDRYIVVFKPSVRQAQGASRAAQDLLATHGGQLKHVYQHALDGFSAQMTRAQAEAIALDPRVDYVEEDGQMTMSAVQTGATWGLDRIDQRDLPLSTTYRYDFTGAGVHAYILDTGIRSTHVEFGGRIGNGICTVDPAFCEPSGSPSDTTDCNGHGTHVSGTVGSATYGVAKSVTLHPVRVLDCDGFAFTSEVVAGIDWVTANHVSPAVANMSLGGNASDSLDAAVNGSIASGVTYAVAAGNSSADACAMSPARVPAALTAGASTSSDARAWFSNFGTCVDLFAPGQSITSTWNTSDTATAVLDGTSMASPHVTGAAALFLQQNPGATPAMVAQVLTGAASMDRLSDVAGSPNRLLYSLPPPFVSINNVGVIETDSGTVNATFTLTLSAMTTDTVTVNWATANGSAVAGSDYVAASGSVVFPPGSTSQMVSVQVKGDTLFEVNETFFVNLGSAANALIADSQGQGTITNNDPKPSLSIGDAVVTEGNSGSMTAVFTVALSAVSGATTTVSYATTDVTATAAGGDYVPASATLTIPAGAITGTIGITVLGDTLPEQHEAFLVDLSSPINATLADSHGQGTIVNDDGRASLCRPIVSLPYTITMQGSYCLTRNLSTSVSSGSAITINSDFVVLDLKGFKIGGGAAGPGTMANGVYALNRKNITVKNGNIRGFLRGIFLEDDSGSYAVSQGHVIRSVRLDENTWSGMEVQGRGNMIRDNQVASTGGSTVFGNAFGIQTFGAGARILNNDVTDTNASTGSAFAIRTTSDVGAVIERNRIANSVPSDSTGVWAHGLQALVVGNRISGTASGIVMQDNSAKYRDNLTAGVTTPYTGGTDAGNNQ